MKIDKTINRSCCFSLYIFYKTSTWFFITLVWQTIITNLNNCPPQFYWLFLSLRTFPVTVMCTSVQSCQQRQSKFLILISKQKITDRYRNNPLTDAPIEEGNIRRCCVKTLTRFNPQMIQSKPTPLLHFSSSLVINLSASYRIPWYSSFSTASMPSSIAATGGNSATGGGFRYRGIIVNTIWI